MNDEAYENAIRRIETIGSYEQALRRIADGDPRPEAIAESALDSATLNDLPPPAHEPVTYVDAALIRELARLRRAGNDLAGAAHRVQDELDGIHRLRLALAAWYTARANEFDRGTD